MASFDSTFPAQVREWANENGYEVGTRGRLSAPLYAAFLADPANKALASKVARDQGLTLPRGRLAKGADPTERYMGLAEALTGVGTYTAA
jgi:hypothetical protein